MKPLNQTMKLLYVEDDEGTRLMLGKLLRQNYPALTVYIAANGKEGLSLFKEHHPELVITDISMPVMDGIEMSRAIRSIASDTVIIAVTAHTDAEYVAQSQELGIDHYILKPVKFTELFDAIDSGIASRCA